MRARRAMPRSVEEACSESSREHLRGGSARPGASNPYSPYTIEKLSQVMIRLRL